MALDTGLVPGTCLYTVAHGKRTLVRTVGVRFLNYMKVLENGRPVFLEM